jgi:hypothetical protein
MSGQADLKNVSEAVLATLKDFQRETVDYVFDRLYGPGAKGRFLLADEVGLGKTLVARGVIARAIEHLEATVPRIDVIYVCSNADIARQNINRLKIDRGQRTTMASRLTMLPVEVQRLKQSRLNFISFTPDTSFDLRSGMGRVEERVLLYRMLQSLWSLGTSAAPMNVLQGQVDARAFRERIRNFDVERVDADAITNFGTALDRNAAASRVRQELDLRARFDALCGVYSSTIRNVASEQIRERTAVIGELRALLAGSCIEALEPDLVILDEFQRFTHLLDGKDDASLLARQLFDFPKVRTLLLSATPYKMYTLANNAQGEDHYNDFLRTIRFLELDAHPVAIDFVVAEYRNALYGVLDGEGRGRLRDARKGLEARLRNVMVRTERLAATSDRNGMLHEVIAAPSPMQSGDFLDYVALQRVARVVEQEDDTLEFWKSAPFLLNFMDGGYKLKRDTDAAIDSVERRGAIAKALSNSQGCILSWAEVERYGTIEIGNARLRALVRDVLDTGAWRLLWIPPSLPHYRLSGAFEDATHFTKRLVFSAWRVVPRVIAGMLSYEAERRMLEGDNEASNTPEMRKKWKPLLRFARDKNGRLSGMPVLAILYPSCYLASSCDPARLLAERVVESRATAQSAASVEAISRDEILALARQQIEVGLLRLGIFPAEDGPIDERWYWAAPLLLDRALDPRATRAWFSQRDLAVAWSGDAPDDREDPDEDGDEDHWAAHVEAARAVALSEVGQGQTGGALGRMPEDLVEVLAELAVAGPAVAMLRAMTRVVGGEVTTATFSVEIRNGAGQAAWAFRSLFNQSAVTSLLRRGEHGKTDVPYWRRVLSYCVDGCLQSVLDEYVHVLRDHLGLLAGTIGERVGEIAEAVGDALRLRTSSIGVDAITVSESGRTVKREPRRMRTHFALRFGDEKSDDGKIVTRADQVRKAFNSPFWPFVVATTSVGQEGLDFHTYCHAVVHWNLPSNPVDLEQREGRVHRYKGHAVRKNVARDHGWAALELEGRDSWEYMFERARESRAAGLSDIVPYWVYRSEGGAYIERHVASLPLSREREQMGRLTKSLMVYRMVFGQPRQEDLVKHMLAHVPAEDLPDLANELRIQLAPRREESSC